MLLFLFATEHRHIFCSSWSRGISETCQLKSRKEICIACYKFIRVLKNLFPNCRSVILKKRDTVNMKTFDQLEHDTRIWYQGTAASKACFQAPKPFPPPPYPGQHQARFVCRYFSYCVFLHDVMEAIVVSQNNETAAMCVSQNAFFCSNKFA